MTARIPNNWRALAGALAVALYASACSRGTEAPAASFEGDGLRVDVLMPAEPLEEGENEIRLRVRDERGAPVDDARVSVQYRMDMAGMAPMGGRVTAEPMGDGEYRADANIEMAGTWQLELRAERPSGEAASAKGSLRTGAAGVRLEASSGAGEGAAADESSDEPLAPVTKSEALSGAVRVDPQRLQKIGVRFATAERAPFTRSVRALGRVTWDETRLVDVALKIRGFVRDLRADALGERVTRGEPLFSVYSPDLYAAQSEFLQVLHGSNDALRVAARARLRLWDIAERDIAALEQRGTPLELLPIRAPASGVLVEKNVVEGAAFEAGMRLFRIAPLEHIWVEAEVYGSDLPLITVGQRAAIRVPYLPGSGLAGRVAYLLPSLASETRTARVRIELENFDLALRPEMFVDVELQADLGERLLVPTSAVIFAGERRVVFVDRGEGRLEPRTVTTGAAGERRIEILSGLEAGERVVESGNFLIAAESRIQSALEQW
ncbi:MAG TPA: efflux RND transporter periplasmic adaptor subunit [Myxococcota bacterium]|nr:efflux RND transporter periplasmic adaptor subunit [Myxococcota bacterium]